MQAESNVAEDPLVILDCTVRDGNYAIDFKFTESDTSLLVQQLSQLGFAWIEVGHGLGLGAVEAGKTTMPADDCTLIRAAKGVSGDALVGAFFIPGIGKMEQLAPARDAGLDFVRCGANAPEAEATFPYIAEARKLGLLPCLNMMKSYAISPEQFAHAAKGAVDAGVEVIYCVDSAGGMMPDRVAEYFDATRAAVDCKMGFHGHNNLMMVIANCVEAYRHGARYLDSSLCGMGRSAGNAPTEILVAIFERMGVSSGVDLFDLLDTTDRYMWPLVAHVRTHDAMGVAAGYSQFHSSFLPKVLAASLEHDAELRRLAAQVAIHNPVEVDDEFLSKTAEALAGTEQQGDSKALVAFHSPDISPDRVSTSMAAVDALVEGLIVSGAKWKSARAALLLVPSEQEAMDLVLPDFVTQDSRAVIGKVTYGSLNILGEVVRRTMANVSVFLVAKKSGWASDAISIVRTHAGAGRAFSLHTETVELSFLVNVLDRAAQIVGDASVLVYGDNDLLWKALAACDGFESLFVLKSGSLPDTISDRAVHLTSWDDWRDLHMRFKLVVCGTAPAGPDVQKISRSLDPHAKIFHIGSRPSRALIEATEDKVVHVDLDRAYTGIVERILVADTVFNMDRWKFGDADD